LTFYANGNQEKEKKSLGCVIALDFAQPSQKDKGLQGS
jgi:hypothetical protein